MQCFVNCQHIHTSLLQVRKVQDSKSFVGLGWDRKRTTNRPTIGSISYCGTDHKKEEYLSRVQTAHIKTKKKNRKHKMADSNNGKKDNNNASQEDAVEEAPTNNNNMGNRHVVVEEDEETAPAATPSTTNKASSSAIKTKPSPPPTKASTATIPTTTTVAHVQRQIRTRNYLYVFNVLTTFLFVGATLGWGPMQLMVRYVWFSCLLTCLFFASTCVS